MCTEGENKNNKLDADKKSSRLKIMLIKNLVSAMTSVYACSNVLSNTHHSFASRLDWSSNILVTTSKNNFVSMHDNVTPFIFFASFSKQITLIGRFSKHTLVLV